MHVFVATSYSTQVDYDNGEVHAEYREWLEDILQQLEKFGHTVFCAVRADKYKINNTDPAAAFKLDEAEIAKADAILALVKNKPSAGVQTEIGMAIAQKKPIVLAHPEDDELQYFNQAIILAGQAREVRLPLATDPFA